MRKCQRRRENASARRSKDASMTNAGELPGGTGALVCLTGARCRTNDRMVSPCQTRAAVRQLEARPGRARRLPAEHQRWRRLAGCPATLPARRRTAPVIRSIGRQRHASVGRGHDDRMAGACERPAHRRPTRPLRSVTSRNPERTAHRGITPRMGSPSSQRTGCGADAACFVSAGSCRRSSPRCGRGG